MKCPFFPDKECPFFKSVDEIKRELDSAVKLCTLCIKAAYALAHLRYSQRNFIVVNTL